jgi:hypothetical protein
MTLFRNFCISLGIILTVGLLAIPIYFGVPFSKNPGPKLDDQIRVTYLRDIEAQKSDVVLMGDSTLYEGINENTLGQLLGKKIYRLGKAGSASAQWYLLLKHNIIPAEPRPETVVILFRASMLTTPEFRTTGKYQDAIDEFSNKNDGQLIELAYLNQMSWFEKLLDQYVPLYSYRQLIRATIEKTLKYRVIGSLANADQPEIDQAIEWFFGEADIAQVNAAIDAAENYLYEPTQLDFSAEISNSFLPEIIKLCKDWTFDKVVTSTT